MKSKQDFGRGRAHMPPALKVYMCCLLHYSYFWAYGHDRTSIQYISVRILRENQYTNSFGTERSWRTTEAPFSLLCKISAHLCLFDRRSSSSVQPASSKSWRLQSTKASAPSTAGYWTGYPWSLSNTGMEPVFGFWTHCERALGYRVLACEA